MARLVLILCVSVPAAFAQASTSSVPYSTPNRGGALIETAGSGDVLLAGYARVQPAASTTPAGAAVFGLRQNGVLVTEAAVPGMFPMTSGRTYAEVNGPINTGVAFANPNGIPVSISFNFTDRNGNDFGQGNFTLAGNAQLAKFLDQTPFNAGGSFAGAFTFNSSLPVGVIALRTLVNERGEFLIATQSVTPIPTAISAGPAVMGHFADSGGWRTEVILVNTTDTAMSGTVQFFSEGAGLVSGEPVTLNVNGQAAASFTYNIRPRSSVKLETSGTAAAVTQVGSVRVTPAEGSTLPSGFTVFAHSRNGVTTTLSTVQDQPPATALRSYVEVTSNSAAAGAIQSGVAIAHASTTSATVNFELTTLSGANTGLTASIVIPPSGHVSRFVHELFPTVPLPFRGILRISSATPVSVVNLRTRYNERRDFLITTVPVTNEASQATTAEMLFPHIVDGAGYSTQFVLFSGIAGQSTTGNLRFFAQDGQALNVNIRNGGSQ